MRIEAFVYPLYEFIALGNSQIPFASVMFSVNAAKCIPHREFANWLTNISPDLSSAFETLEPFPTSSPHAVRVRHFL